MRDSVDEHVARWSTELHWMDPIKEAIFARIGIIARHASHTRRESLTSGGLKLWQFKVLLTLRRLGPPYSASPSQLADMLGLTRGALSVRLAPIEKAGLIIRTTDTADRRRVHARLTPAGHTAFEQHASAEEHSELAILSVLTAKEHRTRSPTCCASWWWPLRPSRRRARPVTVPAVGERLHLTSNSMQAR